MFLGASTSSGPIVTDWVQAVGTLASVGVAVWATVVANRAKQTGKQVADTGRQAVAWTLSVGNDEVNSRLRAEGKTVWRITPEPRHMYAFTNMGSQDVLLMGARDVTVPGEEGDVVLLPGFEGTYISPGNAFKVIYERTVASPAVAKVEVAWQEGARSVTQVYAIS